MSKASEWAKAQTAVMRATVVGRQFSTVATASEPPVTAHASVGWRDGEPMLCITDKRLGGLYLSPASALELARWIIEAFGEPTP